MRIGSYEFSDPVDLNEPINFSSMFDDNRYLLESNEYNFNLDELMNIHNDIEPVRPDTSLYLSYKSDTDNTNESIESNSNYENNEEEDQEDEDDYEYEQDTKKRKKKGILSNKYDESISRNNRIKRNKSNLIERVYKLSKSEKIFYLRDEEYFFFNNNKIPVFLQYLYITCSKKEFRKYIDFHPDGGIQIFDILYFKFKFVMNHFKVQYLSFLKMLKIYNFQQIETNDPNKKIYLNPYFKKFEYSNLYYIKNNKLSTIPKKSNKKKIESS